MEVPDCHDSSGRRFPPFCKYQNCLVGVYSFVGSELDGGRGLEKRMGREGGGGDWKWEWLSRGRHGRVSIHLSFFSV